MVEKGKKRGKKASNLLNKGGEDLSEKIVEFTFLAPEMAEVYLAGDFNFWDTQSLPLKKDKQGVWKTEIRLPPGRYEYKLMADNAWVEDLPGAKSVPNPWGTRNFVVWVR